MSEVKKHQIVIIGAGTGGLAVASRLMQDYPERKLDIAIVDPSEKHYYQPLWTLVGAGIFEKEESERNQEDYIPLGTSWVKEAVESFLPESNQVKLSSGNILEYEYLIIAAGIQINWNAIKGLKESLGKNGVCSNYDFKTVHKTWEFLQNTKSGRAIFTQPTMPIKCAGAPQKALYLSEDYFSKHNLKGKVQIEFCSAGPRIFGVEKYRNALEKVLKRKNLSPRYNHNLVEIKAEQKIAVFEHTETKETIELDYEMIHVVPPMSAPDFIAKSTLAEKSGYVEVDKYTTQHTRFNNVFSLGDCSSLPTSRTGAAIRKQAPVLTKNLISLMDGKPLKARYDGYASCPLVTGYGTCILAEFDYDGNPAESFPFNQAKERFSMYMLKVYALPKLYWHGMLRGKA